MLRLVFSLPLRSVCVALSLTAAAMADPVHSRPLPPPPEDPVPPHPLAWDALTKNCFAKYGDKLTATAFTVTNISPQPVTITAIKASCGCTTTDTPPLPWTLAPGASGTMKVNVDLVDKWGEMTKTIRVTSAPGDQNLKVHISVPLPPGPADERKRMQNIVLADREAIFRRPDCVQCHSMPAFRKSGEALFRVACDICHAPTDRASMVPDLRVAHEERDAAWWRRLISEGREHTLMPGFAQAAGGPLDDRQIESLVEYALRRFPTRPVAGS
jgi:hypothetical protein